MEGVTVPASPEVVATGDPAAPFTSAEPCNSHGTSQLRCYGVVNNEAVPVPIEVWQNECSPCLSPRLAAAQLGDLVCCKSVQHVLCYMPAHCITQSHRHIWSNGQASPRGAAASARKCATWAASKLSSMESTWRPPPSAFFWQYWFHCLCTYRLGGIVCSKLCCPVCVSACGRITTPLLYRCRLQAQLKLLAV